MNPLDRFLIAAQLSSVDNVQAAPFITGHYMLWFAGIPEDNAVEYWGKDYKKKLSAQLKTIKSFEAFPDVMISDFGIGM